MKYSLLDLAPIPEGSTTAEAIASSVALAQAAEAAGYHRHWLAEHHNARGIASSATSVMIGHIAGATSRIRVGSGGVMLPNHAPLAIAEQFGTLATIYPGRIDLGLGRAPGTDQLTAGALRRHMDQTDTFPRDVTELLGFLGDPAPDQKLHAIPGEGTHVPIWILGSSLYGAQLAAHLGLPYAFASHFAPDMLAQASEVYRRYFQPSQYLEKPHFMMALSVFAGETPEEAEYLRSSMVQAFVNIRSGNAGPLPRPVEDLSQLYPAHVIETVERSFSVGASGTGEMVRRQLADLIERFNPDELIVSAQIHDSAKRIRSFQIAAQELQALGFEAS